MRRRYELVFWHWCSVHLGVACSDEPCNHNIASPLACRFHRLYADRNTEVIVLPTVHVDDAPAGSVDAPVTAGEAPDPAARNDGEDRAS